MANSASSAIDFSPLLFLLRTLCDMKKRRTQLLSCGTVLLLIASMSTRAIDIEPFVQQAATNLGRLSPWIPSIRQGTSLGESLTWAICWTRLVCHTRASSLPRVAVICGRGYGARQMPTATPSQLLCFSTISMWFPPMPLTGQLILSAVKSRWVYLRPRSYRHEGPWHCSTAGFFSLGC